MDNIEKNTYEKKQITNALLDLLKVKELKNIFISEITSVAQVSRISFYRNYNGKEDIISEYIRQLFYQWMDEYDRSGQSSLAELMGAMFAHLGEYRQFICYSATGGLSIF